MVDKKIYGYNIITKMSQKIYVTVFYFYFWKKSIWQVVNLMVDKKKINVSNKPK